MVGAEDLKKLRANPTDKVMLVHFWATGCAACTSAVLRSRDDLPDVPQAGVRPGHDQHERSGRRAAVLEFLKKEYASSPNKQFATADRAALQAAWGEKWNLAAPLDDGDRAGRRGALPEGREDRHPGSAPGHPGDMPDTSGYIGSKAYWMNAVEEMARKK